MAKKVMVKKVVKHLKGDIKDFRKEAREDMDLIKKIAPRRKKKKAEKKIERVMEEFKEGELHSGSKKGPQVKSRKQALAIALSESRRAVKKRKKRGKK